MGGALRATAGGSLWYSALLLRQTLSKQQRLSSTRLSTEKSSANSWMLKGRRSAVTRWSRVGWKPALAHTRISRPSAWSNRATPLFNLPARMDTRDLQARHSI